MSSKDRQKLYSRVHDQASVVDTLKIVDRVVHEVGEHLLLQLGLIDTLSALRVHRPSCRNFRDITRPVKTKSLYKTVPIFTES